MEGFLLTVVPYGYIPDGVVPGRQLEVVWELQLEDEGYEYSDNCIPILYLG